MPICVCFLFIDVSSVYGVVWAPGLHGLQVLGVVILLLGGAPLNHIVVRLVPRLLHDFEHPHGFPATLSFNIALTQRLEQGLARMP